MGPVRQRPMMGLHMLQERTFISPTLTLVDSQIGSGRDDQIYRQPHTNTLATIYIANH